MSRRAYRNALTDLLNIELPIIQAPMASVSSPQMAAAVCNSGGLGSIGIGATDAAGARAMINAVRARAGGPFNVNVFCHVPAHPDTAVETAWTEYLRPQFARFGAAPPVTLREIYRSFVDGTEVRDLLLTEKPKVVSFHFGLPSPLTISLLRAAGITLLASATNLRDACIAANAGVDAVIAQGYEAGGHRGSFDPHALDDRLGTMALTRVLVRQLKIPVIAAGGIMDGAGIAAVLRLGASAALLGTAFIACDESQADAGYRAALKSDAALHTVMTRAISGRPARCLSNHFTTLGAGVAANRIPCYPIAYDAGKALNAAAQAAGEWGYGAHWAGQGAPLARELPTADLMASLAQELSAAAPAGTRR